MTSFRLSYLLKILFPNTVTLGFRVSPYEFGENTVESRTSFIFLMTLCCQVYFDVAAPKRVWAACDVAFSQSPPSPWSYLMNISLSLILSQSRESKIWHTWELFLLLSPLLQSLLSSPLSVSFSPQSSVKEFSLHHFFSPSLLFFFLTLAKV